METADRMRDSRDGREEAIDREREDSLKSIATPLLAWYDSVRRILPWREDPAPYHVWVSEIMLQQTRVEAVKGYYERFMAELPDVAALAGVDEDRLLKLWEGLGYYNRARNLKRAAVCVMKEYGGLLPAHKEELMRLPGIGSYTAGAIASIAYGQPVPAVDGNVLRVISRYLADDRCMDQAKVIRDVELLLGRVIPAARPGDYNQALMELGALLCLPHGEPKCAQCPLAAHCRAHEMGRELMFPRKTPKPGRGKEDWTVLLLREGNRTAIRRRPAKGLLAGMYEFPSIPGHRDSKEVLRLLSEKGYHPIRILRLEDARHIFTHKEWNMWGYAVTVDEWDAGKHEGDGLVFVEPSQTIEEYPIPSAFAVYLAYMRKDIAGGYD